VWFTTSGFQEHETTLIMFGEGAAADGPDGHKKSQFTFKHLSQLRISSTTCPLRVVAHVDLDAFYAQCEMVRLRVDENQPLAVQQWQVRLSHFDQVRVDANIWKALIAINYPARKFGLGRHVTATEAKKLCPELIMQHVATWKEGDEKWAYVWLLCSSFGEY
jgi:DNA polymerase eta